MHDVPNFSVMWNLPTESFHLCQEGVTKMVVRRLLEETTNRVAVAIFADWGGKYEVMKVFSESSRRTRRIKTADLKGSEFGLLLYTAFPVLVEILEDHPDGHW